MACMEDSRVCASFESLVAAAAAVNQLVAAGFEHGALELRGHMVLVDAGSEAEQRKAHQVLGAAGGRAVPAARSAAAGAA
jgi:hypothetical protein